MRSVHRPADIRPLRIRLSHLALQISLYNHLFVMVFSMEIWCDLLWRDRLTKSFAVRL